MSKIGSKKLVVINNTFRPVIDSKKNIVEIIVIQYLKTINYIIYNIKLTQTNEEIPAFLDLKSETNLISQVYIV